MCGGGRHVAGPSCAGDVEEVMLCHRGVVEGVKENCCMDSSCDPW